MNDEEKRLRREHDDKFDAWDRLNHPTDAHTFIQWQGTDVCLDFHCPCGAYLHFDTYLLFGVECGHCGSKFLLSSHVRAMRVENFYGMPSKVGYDDGVIK